MGWADDRDGWTDGGLTELNEVVGFCEQVVLHEFIKEQPGGGLGKEARVWRLQFLGRV